MPKITKMERQKHSSSRISVFVDGEYAFSLEEDIVLDYGLGLGDDVEKLNLARIKNDDEIKRGLNMCFRYLSQREKTEKEIRTFLQKKELSDGGIDAVVNRLIELDYINDERYAFDYKEGTKTLGKRGLKFKLAQKGISKEIIENVMNEINTSDQEAVALELAKKQRQKYLKHDIYKQKKSVGDFLARRGFEWDVISYAIEKCFGDSGEDL